MTDKYDVIIIGAGPAGYVAAIRCAQLGLNTACVDNWVGKQGKPTLGGTCLNAGCIPSKALLESSALYAKLRDHAGAHGIVAGELTHDMEAMIAGKDRIVQNLTAGIESLFKSNGVIWLAGNAQLLPDRRVQITAHDGGSQTCSAGHVILATGSVPMAIEAAPLQDGHVVDSAGALDWTDVPERLGIIGAGVVGLELGSVWQRLGSTVTLLEAQDVFLSMADQQLARTAQTLLRKQGLDIRLCALVKQTKAANGTVSVDYEDKDGTQSAVFDRLIVAVGRRPCTEGLTVAETDLLFDEGGCVHVDENCCTNLPGVYAIGDVVRGPMLAHKGSEEGIAVAERIAGQSPEVNYGTIPSVIYTHPEIAWVGKTEEALQQSAMPYRSGVFPFAANGRARAMQETEGMVKVLSDEDTDEVLGVHIIGASASELIGQAVISMEFGGSSEDIARTVFAHPTLSESLHEAALAVDGRALHIARKHR
ncbi:MAG: dihydrolipoyl dehydrogenase [Pseudomonadota bacterium]